jgi:hypothetical protein
MTDILRSTKCEYPVVAYDPVKKFVKTWKLGTQSFEAASTGAKFFYWDLNSNAEPIKVPFVVPYELLNDTNGYHQGSVPPGVVLYPIPCEDPPAGMEVVLGWFPGTLQVRPIGQDSRSFDEKVLDLLTQILTILKNKPV